MNKEVNINSLDISDVTKEIKAQASLRSEKIKNTLFACYVIALAGPEALEQFLKKLQSTTNLLSDSNHWTSKEFISYLDINAAYLYQSYFSNNKSFSWLEGSNINMTIELTDKHEGYLKDCRNMFIKVNEFEKERMTKYPVTSNSFFKNYEYRQLEKNSVTEAKINDHIKDFKSC